MKKLYFTLIAGLAMSFTQAQDITDAVRYSADGLFGTARYRAMGGAFGALGGDLSSINNNPASSAVFLKSSASFTLSHEKHENETGYFGGFSSNNNSEINFDQAGAVLVFNSTKPENKWRKFAIGANYNKTNNFENRFLAKGISNSSIDQYFLGYANGVPLELLETLDNESIADLYSFLGETEGFGAQQAFLGYQGFVINPVTDSPENTSYTSAIGVGSFNQGYSNISTGLNGKFSFNFASEYNDILYVGANLNSHFMNFDRSTQLFESNNNSTSETNEVLFTNNLSTTGSGFSFQLGTIAKLNESFRIGASYESPTWYTVNEESVQRLETYSAEFDDRVVVNPNIINIYPDYKLKTPSKLTGSLAVLFGDQGLISFDYSHKDYSTTEFRPDNDPDFIFQNSLLDEELQAASSYSIGGEYRINNLSLRGGYRYIESPYKNEVTIGNLDGYSFGLGYSFGNIKADLAYDYSSRTDNPKLYQVGLTNTANIDKNMSSLIFTLSFGI